MKNILYIKYIIYKIHIFSLGDKNSKPDGHMAWLRVVGSLKLWVSFAKEPYERDDILQKRPIISRSLLLEATPYGYSHKWLYRYQKHTKGIWGGYDS